MMLESKIERTVCAFAEANGWLVRKIAYIGRRNAADRIFIRDSRVVFVEFKQPDAVPRPGQVREHDRMREHGAEIHTIDNIEAGLDLFP